MKQSRTINRWLMKAGLPLSLFLLLLNTQKAQATHAAGADFTYKCLGGLQYEFTITFYRDCGGVAEPASITLKYSSSTGHYNNLSATANKIAVTGQEITQPCSSAVTSCNGGATTGIRQFVYKAVVTLPAAVPDWVFSYSVCCRNCAITTINSPCAASSNLYVEATLNNLVAPCNNSPLFSNIPIAYACIGQNFNYNQGVLDPDGDSLVYSLITPRTSSTTTVSYIAPHNTTNPIITSSGFNLNPVSGDLNFTPSQLEIGILTLLVKEYRNGQLMGSVIRDMQIYTQICSNSLPTASGINGTNNFSINTCPNQPLCFTINTADAEVVQNVSITTNNGINGATYTVGSGSRPTLTFCWTPTSANVSLLPNTFTVTVADDACPSKGVQTYSYSVFVSNVALAFSTTNPSCRGSATGTAAVAVLNGGTPTYNYSWSNGSTTQNITSLTAGIYTVTVTDSKGCTAVSNTTITEPSTAVSGSISILQNASCNSGNNGALALSVSGGSGPYTYNWSNGQSTQNLNGLPVGSYTVTITDALGCTSNANSNVFLESPPQIFLSSTNVYCMGDNSGTISVHHISGKAPYLYTWSTGQTTQNISGVTIGNYTVTVTDSRGCSVSASTAITQYSDLVGAVSYTDANNGNNGTASVQVFGGHPPYAYLWTNGATTSSISGLLPGTYGIAISDSSGNFTNEVVNISTINSISAGSFIINMGITPQTIFNGLKPYGLIVDLVRNFNVPVKWIINTTKVKDGVDFTYNNVDFKSSAFVIESQYRTPVVNSVISGWQAQGVIGLTTTTQINLPVYGVITSFSNLVIDQENEQLVTPYFANASIPQSIYTVGLPSNLDICDDTYILPHSDPTWATHNYLLTFNTTLKGFIWAGCHAVSVLEGISNPTDPSQRLNFLSTSGLKCYSGNKCGALITETHAGSPNTPYIYSNAYNSHPIMQFMGDLTPSTENGSEQWYMPISTGQWRTTTLKAIQTSDGVSPREGVKLAFGPGFGNSNNGFVMYEGGHSAKGSSPTDVAAQRTFFNFILQAGLAKKLNIVSNIPSTFISGNPTNVSVSVSNGVAPYTYSWTTSCGGVFSNSNSSATSLTFPSLAPQTKCYVSCVVTDACGRKDFISSPISSLNLPPAPYQVTVNSLTSSTCFSGCNGAADLTVGGGTPPYVYNWSNGATTQDVNNLCAGNYILTISDANNCRKNDTITILQPSALQSSIIQQTNVYCSGLNNGKVKISVSGGTLPYSYLWNNNSASDSITGLTAGTYTVTVTDIKGCTVQQVVTITEPLATLNGTIGSQNNINCFGGNSGSINLIANGGSSPYSFAWSNGANTQNISGLVSGNYIVTITDANNCTANASTLITQPAASLASSVLGQTNVKCFGNNTGSINLNVSGGTSPYSYLWSNGANMQNISNLGSGNYSVTITDANNCSASASANITQPVAALSASVSSQLNVKCFGNNTGAINLNVNGGTSAYSYSWSNGANTQNVSGLVSGNYTVTVTDANNCTSTASTTITQPATNLAASIAGQSNVKCFGNNTGSINLSVSGGTTAYNYVWSNGANTQNISGLVSGNYIVTVTDANNCTATTSATITQPGSSLAVFVSGITNVKCFGNNTGTINLNVSGGTLPYNYSWNTGAGMQNISNLGSGNYTVTITDANNCSTTTTAALTQPAAGLSASFSGQTNVKCYGANTGSVNLNVIGGTAAYSYFWSNGSNTQNISGLNAGTYTVTITDANNCTVAASATITQPAATLSVNISSQTNVGCYGNNTGSATVTPAGGTAPYVYLWSNGANTAQNNNLVSGAYTCTITDANNCSAISTANISQPLATLSASISNQTNVKCFGNNTGVAIAAPAGGTSPYAYTWSNGSTIASNNNLAAGSYTCTVTDANNCTTVLSTTITQPAASLNTTIASQINVKCFGDNSGALNLNVSGGTSAYSYAWSNGANTQNITGLGAGNYAVTITDANNCTTSTSANITQPAASLNATVASQTNVKCFGNNTGVINLNLSGGTPSYSYTWSNGANTPNISGLASGSYAVTITDANNCSTTASATITQPSATLSLSTTKTDVRCFGNNTGLIALNANGGTTGYTYQWSNAATTQNINSLVAGTYTVTVTDANNCTATSSATIAQPAAALNIGFIKTDVHCYGNTTGAINLSVSGGTSAYSYLWNTGAGSQNISNLSSGNYTVTVTDANNCTTVSTVNIAQPVATLNAATASKTDVKCFGNATGNITLSVNGGTSPYTYAWSNGATTQNINNLVAGSYSVTVRDVNLCAVIASVTINQPAAAVTTSATGTNVNCNGGNDGFVLLNVNGGTTPYAYNWNNGATSQNITGLLAGNYSVTITDINNCTATTNVVIAEPAYSLSLSSTHTDINCIGNAIGGIDLSVTGGTTPYIYLWSNGSTQEDITNLSATTYTVTVTDNNGCTANTSATIAQPAGALAVTSLIENVKCFGNSTGDIDLTASAGTPPYNYQWSNGNTNPDQHNLNAGTYTVTVTDANGCVLTNTLFITQPLSPLQLASNTVSNVSCYGDSTGLVDLQTSGGTPGYAYTWNNGNTSEDLLNVSSGDYSVVVTDVNNCTASFSITIQQPDVGMSMTAIANNLPCHDQVNGSINLTVEGGTVPYNYLWNTGNLEEDIMNLSNGNYTVTVTDAQGCTLSNNYSLIYSAAVLNSTGTLQAISCHGDSTGIIDLTVNGGTGPFTYAWSSGVVSEDLNNVPTGTYSVSITDINGCTATNTFTLNEPVASLMATNNSANQLCFGDSSGWIDLTVAGGMYPYTISWNTGSNSEDISNLTAGSYQVNITDANGCAWNNSYVISGTSAALNAAFSTSNLFCNGDHTGSIQSIINGGTSPYNVTWNNSINTVNLNNLSSGSYTVMITDSNNCPFTQTISITEPQTLISNIAQQINIDCFSNSSGSVQLAVNGGTTPYTYQWSNGDTTSSVQNLTAGNYNYTITDAHNCTTNGTTAITQPANYLAVTNAIVEIKCHGDATGAIDLNVSGGTPAYNFNWSNGAITEDIQSLTAGTYTVTITDNNGCITTSTYTVNEPATSLAVSASSTTNVGCFGMQSGSIGLLATGGTSPYNYSWNNGAQTDSISSVGAGTYSVLVTDNNGCTTTGAWTLQEPAATLTTTVASTQVQCFGNATGNVNVTVYGGTAPYYYNWSNGSNTEDLSNITAGTYVLTITDAQQCITSLTATINQPSTAITNTLLVTDVFCFGNTTGAIQSQLTGGTAPYTYQWSNGQTTSSLNNLAAGTYSVTITDANGCLVNNAVSVVQPAAALAATAVSQNINCNGNNSGFINLSVNGGMGGYTYLWSNGATTQNLTSIAAGNYSVTVNDNNGCTAAANVIITQPASALAVIATANSVSCNGASNGSIVLNITGGTPGYSVLWNNGNISDSLVDLHGGTYSATVTDVNGCTQTITQNITEPANLLQATLNATAANCLLSQTGSININVNGGTAPYNFSWSNGATTQNLTGQNAGSYTVIITDANGCTQQRSATITDGSALSINAIGGATICVGNTATLSTASLTNVQIQWYFNGIAINGAVNTTFVTPAAGTYTLVATTACGTYTSNPIEIVTRSLEGVSVSNNYIICPGETVQLLAGGGNDYTWTPQQGLSDPNIPNPTASPVVTTNYTVTVRDGYGCSATASVQVAVICDTLDVPNGFSPNSDGTNDHFVIDGINKYPGNIFFVYNRWGNLVYKKSDYDNTWNGQSNVSGIYMGRDLPNGTYYFILDLNNNTKPINSYLVLRR